MENLFLEKYVAEEKYTKSKISRDSVTVSSVILPQITAEAILHKPKKGKSK